MEDKLALLKDYLNNNGYMEDANKIEEIIQSFSNSESKSLKEQVIAMCSPRYLGDLKIDEFPNVYDWWHFLDGIASEVRKII